jgi:ankyrin repeat protein
MILFKKYIKITLVFLLATMKNISFADAPINDMAVESRPALDMSMLEDNFAQASSVDYDAETDYEFTQPTYFKDLNLQPANINYQDKDGKTLLMLIASRDSQKHILNFTLEELLASTNLQDRQGRTALHDAVQGGDIFFVNILLLHGALIDAQDHEGKTPLYYSVENNHVVIADLLLDKGANKKIGIFENGTLPAEICKTQAMKNLFKKLHNA